jgi:hypothetical protein
MPNRILSGLLIDEQRMVFTAMRRQCANHPSLQADQTPTLAKA